MFKNIKTAEQVESDRLQILAERAKSDRNSMLMETDHMMMPDYPSKPAGIEEYRQALRDITDQDGFPEVIDWPVKPK